MIDIKIDKTDDKPYYVQIQEQIRDKINRKEIRPGARLLPLRKWATLLDVNINTLDKALNTLVKENLLHRRRSLGTFVKINEKGKFGGGNKTRVLPKAKILILLKAKNKLGYPYVQEIVKGINNRAAYYHFETRVNYLDELKAENLCWWKRLSRENNQKIIIEKEGILNEDIIKIKEQVSETLCLLTSFASVYRDIPYVIADITTGAYHATEYLINLKHKRIALILRSKKNSPFYYFTDAEKFEGYELALKKHRLPLFPKYQKDAVENDPEKIRKVTKELLALKPVPTAIFCADDVIASEVLSCLQEEGIDVPREMSLIGFNDFLCSQTSQPRITTVSVPMLEMGEKAIDLLFGFTGKFQHNKHLVLETNLVERDSVGPPSN